MLKLLRKLLSKTKAMEKSIDLPLLMTSDGEDNHHMRT